MVAGHGGRGVRVCASRSGQYTIIINNFTIISNTECEFKIHFAGESNLYFS